MQILQGGKTMKKRKLRNSGPEVYALGMGRMNLSFGTAIEFTAVTSIKSITQF